nr:DUF1120 domain-containing protein [uncultured Cupriavidus sp.]
MRIQSRSIASGLVAALLAMASHNVVAGSISAFRLRANMIPVSCNVSLSNNGTVDFGVIRAQDLKNTEYTDLGYKTISLTLTCDAAAKVAVTAADGRKGSVAPGVGKFLYNNQDDASMFGVGSVDGKNIGAYIIYREDSPTADGASIRPVFSNDGGASWHTANDANNAIIPDTRLHSWAAASGDIAPGSFVSLTQPYKIRLGLNSKDKLPSLTRDIPIDGLATFTLTYL